MPRLVALFALTLVSCVGIPVPKESISDPGALLYNGYTKKEVGCYRCHNGDGLGGRGPSLAVRVPKLSVEKMEDIIKNGERSMPKYGGKMTDEEVTQVATWLKATFH